MPRSLLTVFAVATVLSAGMLDNQAGAMTLVPPSVVGIANADGTLVQKAAVICGNNGCAPVQTKRVQRHKKPPQSGQPGAPIR